MLSTEEEIKTETKFVNVVEIEKEEVVTTREIIEITETIEIIGTKKAIPNTIKAKVIEITEE